jgi:tetratricopeptide (TPR) repeat protein
MLGDHDEKALDLGREALAMADDLAIESIRARVLNTLGVSRLKLGDPDGLADIERSFEGTQPGSPERLRAYINLATMLGDLGELRRSFELHEEGLREAERFGAPGPVRWLRAEVLFSEYITGRWDVAFLHAEDFLAEAETRESHYMDPAAHWVRAEIRLSRGDEAGALADAERALAMARDAQDPQVLYPSLAIHSHFLLATGRRSDAEALVDELVPLLRSSQSGFGGAWVIPLAAALVELGRADEFGPLLTAATMMTPWLEAARAYANGGFEEAAEILGDIGAVPDEAHARVRAAEALASAGRRAEADAQLEQALTFFRSVGATVYIREAESLFAASA